MLNKLQAVRKNANKKGFTLVELIVVIIIIAILAAVAIPAIAGFQDSARRSRIQSEHRQLVSAAQSFIGTLDKPEEAATKLTAISQLAPYVSNSQGANLVDNLAVDGAAGSEKSAHEISNGKLISTFTSRSGGTNKQWTYDFTTGGVSR